MVYAHVPIAVDQIVSLLQEGGKRCLSGEARAERSIHPGYATGKGSHPCVRTERAALWALALIDRSTETGLSWEWTCMKTCKEISSAASVDVELLVAQ
jgi:hypothetical protein